jgi:hypothetical protein
MLCGIHLMLGMRISVSSVNKLVGQDRIGQGALRSSFSAAA